MKRKRDKSLTAWLTVAVYCAFIFILSSFPIVLPKGAPSFSDKVLHVIEYFFLGLLIARAIHLQRWQVSIVQKIMLVTEFSLLYAVSDELHQFFVPGRLASNLDVLADGIGGLIGGIVYLESIHRINKQ